MVISAAAVPSLVLGYREAQFELQAGNVLVQNQFYTSSPVQRLFHSQAAAGTDTEAFAFGRTPDGAINLAQSNAGALAATDTGFYTATFSFLKFENPTATGYLHTTIGDPIHTLTPVFSSLIFPWMIKKDTMMSPASSIPVPGSLPGINNSTVPAAGDETALSVTRNASMNNLTRLAPVFKNAVSTEVGSEDTTNILAVTATPTPAPTVKPDSNVTNATGKANVTKTPAAEDFTPLPKSASLLTRPMARQANRPFTESIDPDYNPRKATREEIQNISGWDRFTTNVIGRSGIDSTYMNRTAYPGYINPWNVIKLADQYKVMSDSANMTMAGSWLNPRMWAL